MDIELKVEYAGEFNAARTSQLACRAFGKSGAELSWERFKWTVEDGYDRVIVASAFVGGEKIGQAAAILKLFSCNGNVERVAELADLFVSPDHRDFATVSAIYRKLKMALADEQITRIYTYPNPGARLLNRRFFRLDQYEVLPLRLGLSTGIAWRPGTGGISVLKDIDEIAAEYDSIGGGLLNDGLLWSKDQFRRRISSPVHRYLMASDGTFALLASPRKIRGVKLLLITASLQRESRSQGFGRTRACKDCGDDPPLVPVEEVAEVAGLPPRASVDDEQAVLFRYGVEGEGLEVVVVSGFLCDGLDPGLHPHGDGIDLDAVVEPEFGDSFFHHFLDWEIKGDSPPARLDCGEFLVPDGVALFILYHESEGGACGQFVL